MHKPATADAQLVTVDAPVLLAILIAARKTGDELLETVARRELEQRHGISIQFAAPRRHKP